MKKIIKNGAPDKFPRQEFLNRVGASMGIEINREELNIAICALRDAVLIFGFALWTDAGSGRKLRGVARVGSNKVYAAIRTINGFLREFQGTFWTEKGRAVFLDIIGQLIDQIDFTARAAGKTVPVFIFTFRAEQS